MILLFQMWRPSVAVAPSAAPPQPLIRRFALPLLPNWARYVPRVTCWLGVGGGGGGGGGGEEGAAPAAPAPSLSLSLSLSLSRAAPILRGFFLLSPPLSLLRIPQGGPFLFFSVVGSGYVFPTLVFPPRIFFLAADPDRGRMDICSCF